jgi:hypothetical protein
MKNHFVISGTDVKNTVREALEQIDVEIVRPEKEDVLFKEAVDLVERLSAFHGNSFNIKESSGELLKQLVMAQGIPEETISTEGFMDLLTKVKNALTGRDDKGVKPTDKKPGAHIGEDREYSKEGQTAIKSLVVALDKYYLNDKWLNSQTFVTGQVKADDFSSSLVLDNKLGSDPLNNIDIARKRVNEWCREWEAIVGKLEKQVLDIDARVKKETAGASGDDEQAIAHVKAAIEEFKSLKNPLKEIPKFNGTSLGNLIPVNSNRHLGVTVQTKPTSTPTLPALTKEQIKHAAGIIKAIYNYKDDDEFIKGPTFIGWLDHSDGSTFSEWLHDVEENGEDVDEYYMYDHHSASWLFIEGAWDLIDQHAIAKALEKWIDRSIK